MSHHFMFTFFKINNNDLIFWIFCCPCRIKNVLNHTPPFSTVTPVNPNLKHQPWQGSVSLSESQFRQGSGSLHMSPYCPVCYIISSFVIRLPWANHSASHLVYNDTSAPFKLNNNSRSRSVKAIKPCCIWCSLPDPNSGPVLPNDNNRFQSHHLLCYWCSHINTVAVAVCHALSLPCASVVSECVTPHLLFDALWPLSPRPFWKKAGQTRPNTAHHLVHVSLYTVYAPLVGRLKHRDVIDISTNTTQIVMEIAVHIHGPQWIYHNFLNLHLYTRAGW